MKDNDGTILACIEEVHHPIKVNVFELVRVIRVLFTSQAHSFRHLLVDGPAGVRNIDWGFEKLGEELQSNPNSACP